ncbi:MAG: hypothetical protein AB2A00_22775, partial [Myxococcota bacterium]
MIAAWLLVSSLSLGATPGPSLAVMGIEPKGGITADTADLIADAVVAELRASGTFSRIATLKDLETAVGLDRQKQLMACDSTSCLAEIGGALNVTYVMAGSVGAVGESMVFTLRVVAAATGNAAASVTERVRSRSPDVLLDRVKPMISELEAQLRGAAPTGLRESAPTSSEDSGGPGLLPLAGVGGVGAVG